MQYGLAGGRTNQGQGFTRYQISGDPSPYYPVFAAGYGFHSSPPAYMMPNRGGPYRYGSTHVNGLTNLISDGDVCRPIMTDLFDINGFNTQQELGFSATLVQSIVTGQPAHTRIIMLQNALNQVQAIVNHNGEMVYQDTVQNAAQMGAVSEGFTGVTGTATVTNGAASITIASGPALTGVTLTGPTGGYGYTPDFNNPKVGDIIEVVQSGFSNFHRIASITLSAGNIASVGIYPNYGGANASGLTYRFWRTGWGSSSNVAILYNTEDIYMYYAGNVIRNSLGGAGTIECIHVNAKSPFTFQHFTAPNVGGIAGRPAATDIIYFKGFLLYGAGNAIGWSVAPFPSTFVNGSGNPVGFGAGDFPAESVDAFQTNGVFLYFERVGDQVFAHFTNSTFVVSTTGSVPEFDIIQLPTSTGATMIVNPDPQTLNNTYMQCRGSAQGEAMCVFRSPSGLQSLSSTSPQRLSQPVEAAQISDRGEVQYSNMLDFFTMSIPNAQQLFAYFWEVNEWTLLNFQEIAFLLYGISPDVALGNLLDRRPRRLGLAGWRPNGRIYLIESFNAEFEEDCPGAGGVAGDKSVTSWKWATPIISLGDIYEGFQLGSFRPLIRPAEGDLLSPPVGQGPTMSVTVYGGYSPTQMGVIYGPFTVDYSGGVPPAIQMPNIAKSDVPYVGFTFSGQRWCELVGVGLYPVGTVSRR